MLLRIQIQKDAFSNFCRSKEQNLDYDQFKAAKNDLVLELFHQISFQAD